MTERISLADVEGTLCIKYTTTDYSNPVIVTHYWPTVLKTRDVLYFFFEDRDNAANLATMHAKRTMPGEYYIGTKETYPGAPWKQGKHVRLTDGGATQPVKTETTEAKQPKVRKGTMLYWSSGYWVKHTSKGVEKIDPLGV